MTGSLVTESGKKAWDGQTLRDEVEQAEEKKLEESRSSKSYPDELQEQRPFKKTFISEG